MAESVSTRPPSPRTTQSRPPSVTRWIPTARDSRGARAPNVAKASTGIDVSRPVSGTDRASPSRTSGSTGPTATAAGRRFSDRATSPTRISSRPPEAAHPAPRRPDQAAVARRGQLEHDAHRAVVRHRRQQVLAGHRCERIVVQDEVDPTLRLGGRHRQSVVDADDRPRVAQPPAGEQPQGRGVRLGVQVAAHDGRQVAQSKHVLDRAHLHAPDRAAGVLEVGVVDVHRRTLDVQRRPQQATLLEPGFVGQAHVVAVENAVARQRERPVLLLLAVLLDGRAADVGAERREHAEPGRQLQRLVVELGALPVAVHLLEQHHVGAPLLHLADDAVEVVAVVPEPAVDVEAQHRQVARRTGRARRDGRRCRLSGLPRRRGATTTTATATATATATTTRTRCRSRSATGSAAQSRPGRRRTSPAPRRTPPRRPARPRS